MLWPRQRRPQRLPSEQGCSVAPPAAAAVQAVVCPCSPQQRQPELLLAVWQQQMAGRARVQQQLPWPGRHEPPLAVVQQQQRPLTRSSVHCPPLSPAGRLSPVPVAGRVTHQAGSLPEPWPPLHPAHPAHPAPGCVGVWATAPPAPPCRQPAPGCVLAWATERPGSRSTCSGSATPSQRPLPCCCACCRYGAGWQWRRRLAHCLPRPRCCWPGGWCPYHPALASAGQGHPLEHSHPHRFHSPAGP